jgi:hypothetical protein
MGERLTERNANGTAKSRKSPKSSYMGTVYEEMAEIQTEILNRLCDLEDKIEQGKIVELPCAVGSQIYFADHENKSVWAGNVVSFSLDAAHLWFNCHYKCGLNMWHPIEDFGKTVFLPREEAEKALERSENGKS